MFSEGTKFNGPDDDFPFAAYFLIGVEQFVVPIKPVTLPYQEIVIRDIGDHVESLLIGCFPVVSEKVSGQYRIGGFPPFPGAARPARFPEVSKSFCFGDKDPEFHRTACDNIRIASPYGKPDIQN